MKRLEGTATPVAGARWLADGATTIVHGMPGQQVSGAIRQPPEGRLKLRFQRAAPSDVPIP